MNSQIKKYKAHILGDTYSIVSDEKESFILESVQSVDSVMREISEKMPTMDKQKVAVLAALKIASGKIQLEHFIEEEKKLSSKIMDVLDFNIRL